MKNVQKIDLGLTGYDELFANDEERKVNKLPRIFDIPISEIDDFPDHPFKVKIDEDMDQLVQSIKERGIITPVTLRPKEDGRYEIVSGHRRKKACELAGLDTVKAEVREMSRDEAIILMVESNLQRSTILPSEKAFSYKMRLEAMNRQGQRTDLTSVPVAQKSTSREQLGKEVGESQDQVRRYIRLTQLIQPLLDLVDEGRIAFRPAVELSYLKKEEQEDLLEEISYADATPSLAQAIKMKRFSQEGKLSNEVIESIMSEEKPNQKEKIRIKYETEEKTETVIVETDDGEGNIVEEEVEETTVYLYITVSHKTVEEMMAQYGFTEDQKAQVAELLSQDSSMWASVLYGIYGADDQIVAVALSQLGNVGGEPYWSWYGFGSRVEWCACFVSWCADQCGYIETGVIPKYAGCVNGVNWFKDRGQWADNDIEPAPGMIIFFDWDNKGSSGPQDGESDHTGIVERVEDGIVYTVEGNSGDSCRENHYAVGYYEILGYGIPAY